MVTYLLGLMIFVTPLKPGDVAPNFSTVDTDGQRHALTDMLTSGPVVLAFFPKAFTPGCTQELTQYQSRTAAIQQAKVHLLAISGDDSDTLKRFKADLQAAYTFIPDPTGKLLELYGAKSWPFNKRVTFVIGQKGTIIRIDTGSDALDPAGALSAAVAMDESSKKSSPY